MYGFLAEEAERNTQKRRGRVSKKGSPAEVSVRMESVYNFVSGLKLGTNSAEFLGFFVLIHSVVHPWILQNLSTVFTGPIYLAIYLSILCSFSENLESREINPQVIFPFFQASLKVMKKKEEEEEDNYIRLYIYNGVRKGIYEEGFTGKGRFI